VTRLALVLERGTRAILDATTIRYFHQCRCGHRGVSELRRERAYETLPLTNGLIVRGHKTRLFDALGHERGPDRRCPECNAFLIGRELKGVYAPEIECNDSCRMATGPDCRCSCGGAHHGEGNLT